MEKEPPDKVVGKRKDRSAKLADRKNKKETIVKCCLRKYLRGEEEQKTLIINAINGRVEAYSKRVHSASLAISGYIKEKFNNVEDVCNVTIQEVFDVTFFRQLMLGLEDAIRVFDGLQGFLERNPRYIIDIPRHQGDRNTFSAGATSYITNLKTSLRMNLSKRIKHFLKIFQQLHNLSDDQRVFMMYKIHGWNYSPRDYNLIESPFLLQEVSNHRKILGLNEGDDINDRWSKETTN